jgi:DNA-binding transcriptional ArsR family regulator
MVKSNTLQLDRVFHALSDSTRRAILRNISKQEKTVGEIADPFRMSLAAISKHLKVLERAKLIKRRKQGSFQLVALNVQALSNADQWLAFYRQFWVDRLDSLQELLEGKGHD